MIDKHSGLSNKYPSIHDLEIKAKGRIPFLSWEYLESGTGDEHAIDDGKWALGYMNTYTGTISGGSSEIQRNILGERVLGLPKTK